MCLKWRHFENGCCCGKCAKRHDDVAVQLKCENTNTTWKLMSLAMILHLCSLQNSNKSGAGFHFEWPILTKWIEREWKLGIFSHAGLNSLGNELEVLTQIHTWIYEIASIFILRMHFCSALVVSIILRSPKNSDAMAAHIYE